MKTINNCKHVAQGAPVRYTIVVEGNAVNYELRICEPCYSTVYNEVAAT